MKKFAWLPVIPGTFLFVGLHKHAEPFMYYYLGAFVMIFTAGVCIALWKSGEL